jgi:DNA-binding CsgD family transcriptional regulator
MLDRRKPIAMADGRLRAADPFATEGLRRAIGLAALDEPEIGASGIGMALGGGSGEAATAHVLPLARGDPRTGLLPRAAAAVFVASELQLHFARLEAVAEAFGLTPAETRLLERLVRGQSMTEAAAAMNIAMTTAKTHRTRLLSKTGAHRQAGLISLVHRLVPALGALAAPPAESSKTLDQGFRGGR